MSLALDRTAPLGQLTSDFLQKNYFPGLEFVDQAGNPFPEDYYDLKIQNAIAKFELDTQVSIHQHVVKNEKHDWVERDYSHFAYIQLYHFPVFQSETVLPPSISCFYGARQLLDFSKDWLTLDEQRGRIYITPSFGMQGMGVNSVLYSAGLRHILSRADFIPQFFHVAYTAGFPKDEVPKLFSQAIAKLAMIEIFTDQADTVFPPGQTSLNISQDGLSTSQSIQQSQDSVGVFGGRIKQYKAELYGAPGGNMPSMPGLLTQIRDYYRESVLLTTA